MRNGVLCTLVAISLLTVAPSAASARPTIGIGDQKADMFADPRFRWLDIRHARIVVPWYIARSGPPAEREHLDRWLRKARIKGVRPLVGFGHGFSGWTRIYLPSVKEYRRAIKAFRRRWPQVKEFIVWNEANHCSQPTCNKPRRVARYHDVLRKQCRKCRIVAADVLDQPNMVSWLRRFRRAAKRKPKLYGLHNYLDVNRLHRHRTRRFVRVARGRVWITETGGVVRRRHYRGKAAFPESERHAAKVTRHLRRMLRRKKMRRVKRVYLYHWNVDRPDATWDSGLFDWTGAPRPSYAVLARWLGRDPAKSPAAPPPPLPPPGEPPLPQPPPSEPEPAGEQPPAEEPASAPAPPDCAAIATLCPPLALLGGGGA